MSNIKDTSRHHLVSQKFGGRWQPDNIVRLSNKVHTSFHVVFSHATPIQQIHRLLDLNERAMQPDVVEAIRATLKRYEGIFELTAYNPKCVDSNKFLNSLRGNQ